MFYLNVKDSENYVVLKFPDFEKDHTNIEKYQNQRTKNKLFL